jgi:excisionase family DNA binding protein
VDELAAYLGVPKATVYGCWRQWGLRGYRVGRHLWFREVGGWPTADARMAADGDAVVVETVGQTRHGLLERVQLVEQVVHAFRRGAIKPGRLGALAKVSPAVWLIGTVMSTGMRRSAGPPGSSAAADSSRAQRR